MLSLSEGQIALAAFSLATAGLVKGATGVGYSTTALPLMALGMGLENAMPLVLLPSISSNVFVMMEAGHFRQTVRRFWPLYAATLPGLAVGLAGLHFLDKTVAAGVLGVVLIAYALYALSRPRLTISEATERWLLVPVGAANGFLNGLTGSQILPVMPFMLSLPLSPSQVVQATNIAFTLSSLVMIGGLAWLGYLNWHTLALSALGIVFAYLGVRAGTLIRRSIDVETFRKLVLALLSVLGAGLLLPLLWLAAK